MAEKARANSVSSRKFQGFRTKGKRPARKGLRAGAGLSPAGIESGSILYHQPGRQCLRAWGDSEGNSGSRGMGRPCLVGPGWAEALSGCWESLAPLLILARRRTGPRGCRYGGDPGAESVAWDPGRGRRTRGASRPAHNRPLSWQGNRPWFCI